MASAVSPELALVDPELRAVLAGSLCDYDPDAPPQRPRRPAEPAPAPAKPAPAPAPARPAPARPAPRVGPPQVRAARRRRPSIGRAVLAVCLAANVCAAALLGLALASGGHEAARSASRPGADVQGQIRTLLRAALEPDSPKTEVSPAARPKPSPPPRRVARPAPRKVFPPLRVSSPAAKVTPSPSASSTTAPPPPLPARSASAQSPSRPRPRPGRPAASGVAAARFARARAPRSSGARAKSFAWDAMRGATNYRFTFLRGSKKLLVLVSDHPGVALPAGFALRPGQYQWTVEARLGSGAAARWGGIAMEGGFVVP